MVACMPTQLQKASVLAAVKRTTIIITIMTKRIIVLFSIFYLHIIFLIICDCVNRKLDTMELIKQYIRSTNMVAHQIDTYNDFVQRGIQNIVDREPEIVSVTHKIRFNHVYLDVPRFTYSNRITEPLFPNEARKRNISYESTIYANIKVTSLIDNTEVVHNRVPIGKMPTMIGSCVCNLTDHNKIQKKECPNDYGGYFIIKGKERVLIGQLRPAYNRVYVYPQKIEKYKYVAEIRSMNASGTSVLIQAKINGKDQLFFSLPYIKDHIPAGLIFRVLEVSEGDMIHYASLGDEKMEDILLQQYNSVDSIEEALEIICKSLPDKDPEYVMSILRQEVFCHIGFMTLTKTAIHLGYILKKLAQTSLGVRTPDDKDNLANKRLDTSASLIGFLFRGLFKQFLKTISNQMSLKKNPDPLTIIKSSNNITHGLNMCFMTGNWNTQKTSSYTRVGVSQVLSRQNYGAFVSHLRRIMLPIGNEGKNQKIRQLHSSHFGFICPYETPEGATVGIVANLALTAEASVEIPSCEIMEVVKTFDSFTDTTKHNTLILLNGVIVGSVERGLNFYREFKSYRASDTLDGSIGIVFLRDENEIHIQSDHGRLIRPLFALERNKTTYQPNETWKEAVSNHHIVFRDVWELEHSVAAMTEADTKLNKCDYQEICPAGVMMGIMASAIPYANHSQSPRIAYQSSMGKQAIGMPSLAYKERYDTTLQVLDTPQKPITRSEMVNIVKFDEMTHGAVPIVAIMTYGGFNQEDSVLLNKASIDRGLFMSTTYKTLVEEERKRGNSDFETICLPKVEYRKRDYNYSRLDENGIIKGGKSLFLKKDDVVIGKVMCKIVKKQDTRTSETTDASIVIKHGEEGYLDSVLDTTTNEGVRVVKIRIRIPRRPEIGDKFASSTAQKGTCGMIYSQEDMPFDKNGITPDLIMNPHAIPSRMTINMLIEMCYNLIGCTKGEYEDATTFNHPNVEKDLAQHLEDLGWSSYNTTLYSGFTGGKFPSKIFMGPAFYQRLKHMVSDKIHARMCGPLDTLTHQPVAGRAKDGGLRFGEMERDCMLGHGSSRFLKECLFDKSDKYTVSVCTKCGIIPQVANYCYRCDDTEIEMKNMPYATKLLYQELMGMGIKIKLT